MAKIYMAGPLFSLAERAFNSELAGYLRGKGHEVFLPQDSEQNQRAVLLEHPARDIFLSDVTAIDDCDVVLANLDGSDPDSGTCWEIGYAYALGKDIVCYRTDFRVHEGFDPINLMLTESANKTFFFSMDRDALSIALDLHKEIEELSELSV